MENDSKKELDRLKRQLSAMNRETKDILMDIPIDVLEVPAPESEPEEIETLTSQEVPDTSPAENMDAEILQGREETAKMLRRENRWLVGLMILASLLCAGIIGLMIYWLEVLLS